jgi:hypothetical protein
MPIHNTPRPQTNPLDSLIRRLEDTPSPRDSTRHDWAELEQLYDKWHRATPERSRQRYWYQAKAYRLGKVPEDKTSLVAQTLHLYEQHRIHDDRLRRKASGFDQRREIIRKAKDPEGYKAAAAQRQREYRARQRQRRQAEADLNTALKALDRALDAPWESASEADSEPEWRRYDPAEDVEDEDDYLMAAE